ncbi:rho guanine nucleotide exchange factor 8-like [Ananas comosus]|uniref:Rho guanine nucleotide exchange factor 8 n=1 Tax=Ananas comosus TaxID=4615 RepID=A0A199VUD8_ANACO|nr:rho guanine nucleotide exchange factor 8-like [Ananas comosus]XP_020088048.1 rho guanine nucleotide exchange factor 8-like [Ananas comosus]OAY80546.1 Rho guanine nucleotide exchange factor 8 [Ananas comosus]
MVRFLKRGHSLEKWSRGGAKEMFEIGGVGGNGSAAAASTGGASETTVRSRHGGAAANGGREGPPSDMELMKERFAKLLLGEDMSGSGKGVSSALAISNAITNLAASVFGEHRKLEPIPPELRARWRKEVDWLLSVTDHIVEFVPSAQTTKDGQSMEIMITQQRRDLQMNIPALKKLDAMLIGFLDNFKDQTEFWYVKADSEESDEGSAQRKGDKWWLPTVKVPSNGLSEMSRKWLQYQKESANQVLKAAMAINAQVLMEMEVPEVYIESLPRNGRASLGDVIYKSITVDTDFDPEEFLASMDLSTEHNVLDLKNRIEASIVIWKRKMHNKDGKSSWGSMVSLEKREAFEERAETILHLLKHKFPGIPQSSLDISKIQYNKDAGHAILESYSRILESLAFSVMSRIEDVLYADSLTQDPSLKDSTRRYSLSDSETPAGPAKKLDPKVEMEKLKEAPNSMTLWDFMGWHFDSEESKTKEDETADLKKPPKIEPTKKFSYIEKVEHLGGLRSPTARH